jgi:Cu/Ag efflux protein CusF
LPDLTACGDRESAAPDLLRESRSEGQPTSPDAGRTGWQCSCHDHGTMKSILPLLACAVVIGLSPVAPASAQVQAPLSKRDAVQVTITARVEALDLATREVTLKGPLGNVVTFTVDKRVARLNEVKVGDEVTADYYVAYAAEVRPATDQEKANPIMVLEETVKAPAGTEPAGGALRVIRAVVTVEGLDRPTKSLTVMGPKGHTVTVQVEDVANLSKLRIGDTMVVTYAEALAVSLQKRAPK